MSKESLIKRVTSITAARSVSILSALFVSMVLTRLLPESEYGAYRTVWILYSLMGPIVTSALTGLLYFRTGQAENRENTIASSLIWGLLFSLIMALVMWLGFPIWKNFFHADGLQIAFRNFSIYLFLSGFTCSIEAIFVVKHRKKWLFVHNVISNGIEFSTVVIPFYLGYSLETVTLALITAPLLRSVFLIAFTFKDVLGAEWERITSILRKDGSYMLGLMFISLAGITALQLDSWVIRWFYADDAIFAIYVVGARKIPFLSALMSSVSAGLILQIGKMLKNGDIVNSMPIIARISGSLATLIWPFLALIFVFAEEIMLILFGGYEASASIFRIYLIAILAQFFLADTVLLAKGKNTLVLKAGIFELLVNLILSIPFVYWFGITGPAWATLISYSIFVMYSHRLVNSEFGIKQSLFAYISIEKLKSGFLKSIIVLVVFYELKKLFELHTVILFIVGGLFLLLVQYLLNKQMIQQIKKELFQHDKDDFQEF